MPQESSSMNKTIQSRFFAPVIGFLGLESIIEIIARCRNDPQKAETSTTELLRPWSYAMLFVGKVEGETFRFECEGVPGIISNIVSSLEQIAKQIFNEKQ